MKKCEVLSPVGDLKNFYIAVKSGADAVYLGLNKYNARMRAENITLDNLPEVVRYAHLKSVRVYVTLNTILTDKEIPDVVDMVGECLRIGVDAFIVQDVGLITVLKKTFSDIVLHGSTQLGVHNVRGARMAKRLGLSRVVLSRECTIEDIQDIANNVDIELEVFVQGAMCVSFSGNCYMSSLKCNASGNRGECKQLCRLDYTLSDGNKSLIGYALSPRDNCMLKHVGELADIGVASLKIEGRLRHSGYVGIATNVYREIVDNPSADVTQLEKKLAKVFSRGEYISGYIESNNIIDPINNNHIGEKIGTVISCAKFKDIYKITINSDTSINSGDGLKFLYGKSIQSMGVGNVDKNGNNYIVYGKNYINNGSIVYKSLDIEFENNIQDYSKRLKTNVYVEALCGCRISVEYRVGDVRAKVEGDICEPAKKSPVTEDTFIKQLSKVDSDIFNIEKIDVVTDGVFVVVSAINELRRRCIQILEEKLLNRKAIDRQLVVDPICNYSTSYDRIAIVNEDTDVSSLTDYDALIFSPMQYSIDVIEKFEKLYRRRFTSPLIINLPIIGRVADMPIIDKIVSKFNSKDTIFIANNIYALDYIDSGVRMWAGAGLNIMNSYSASRYHELGCEEIIGSVERWNGRQRSVYKMSGNDVLMTIAHCPYKTLYNNDCSFCRHNGRLMIKSSNGTFRIVRQKIDNCYFEIIENRLTSVSGNAIICDLR